MQFNIRLIFTPAEYKKASSLLGNHKVLYRNRTEVAVVLGDGSVPYPRNLNLKYGVIRVVFTNIAENQFALNEEGHQIDHIDVLCDNGSNRYRSAYFTIVKLTQDENVLKVSVKQGQAQFGWPSDLFVNVSSWNVHESKLLNDRTILLSALAGLLEAKSKESAKKSLPTKKKAASKAKAKRLLCSFARILELLVEIQRDTQVSL